MQWKITLTVVSGDDFAFFAQKQNFVQKKQGRPY
jgi:hypothetical protein